MSSTNNEERQKDVAISRRLLGGEAPILINEMTDRCLYSGFFGTLDSVRMKKVNDAIMEVANRNDHDIMIIDLSNVEVIDSAVAGNLKKLNKLLQLLGMEVVFCGFKPIVASSMISAGINLDNIKVEKNLKRAINYSYKIQGLQVVPINK
jgi:rsbT co-antagonist protein RsbR